MRVASPCSMSWDEMAGDDRVRRCDSCRLNIYNTAEMTAKDIETLVREREGRLCIRLYRRADGTVITKDCPVGLRAVRKRIARFASACVAAIIGCVSVSYGQDKRLKPLTPSVVYERNEHATSDIFVLGTVMDSNAAVISGAKVELYQPRDARRKGKSKPIRITTTDREGSFVLRDLAEGVYEIEVQAQGFKRMIVVNVKTVFGTPANVKIVLEESGQSVVVGLLIPSA